MKQSSQLVMSSGARLYHGTGIYALAAIVESNELLEGTHWGRVGEPHGPRLSLRPEQAGRFILNSMHWGKGGLIVLDGEKLARDFPLVEYIDVDCRGERWPEEDVEIVAVTPKIVPLDRYLISVVCSPHVIQEATNPEQMQFAMDECGWAFDHDAEGLALAGRALLWLLDHPLLNVQVPDIGLPVTRNWNVHTCARYPVWDLSGV